MKYMSAKKTLLVMLLSFVLYFVLWSLPVLLENMVLQKIVFVLFTVWGVALALLFFFVNGGVSTLTEGTYEKEYYRTLREGRAINEGVNNRPNPFHLTLCHRIYYAKLLLALLFPVILIFAFEYVVMVLENFFGGEAF